MATGLNERTQYVDMRGKPLSSGEIFIGDVGVDPVLNPKAIFSDRELTIPLANPQTLDSNGRAINKIWLDGSYSLQANDIDDVQAFQDLDRGATSEATGIISLGSVVGSDTITATASPAITAYVDKQIYIYKQPQTNTAAATLNIDGIGAKPIVKFSQEALAAGDLPANLNIPLIYNLTNDNFRMLEPSGASFVATPPTLQVFETSDTWNRPTGCTKIKVTVVGGGGGGGSAGASECAAGGGAGGTGISFIDVTAIASVSVTIGAGGAGQTGVGSGAAGGATSFASSPAANGGAGGEGTSGVDSGGAGGLATAGDIQIGGGGGGGGESNDEIGGGTGGNSIFGGGGPGIVTDPAISLGYGGGGGGAHRTADGGDGHDGVVIVEEYYG